MGDSKGKQAQPRVCVSADKQRAHLLVPANFSRPWVTMDLCRSLLRDAGVQLSVEVQQTVESLLKQLPPEGEPVETLIAEARLPRHGEDAQVQWLIKEPEHSEQDTSFYERSAFVMVSQGQTLAQISGKESDLC